MAQGSSIEWTEATWNPVAGCTPVSPGCLNCYAARMALRLEKMSCGGFGKYEGTATKARDGRPVFSGRINLDPGALRLPYRWKLGRLVFVNSMSDLFHEGVPDDFIHQVFDVMNDCKRHTFQVLTKRPQRAALMASSLHWGNNIWMGASVENAMYRHRVDVLRAVPAKVRFLSCEPLLGSLRNLNLDSIHWVIVGGESGPGARPMSSEWVDEIKSQCLESSVAFFFKQWGGVNKTAAGRQLHGRTWDELPNMGSRTHGAA